MYFEKSGAVFRLSRHFPVPAVLTARAFGRIIETWKPLPAAAVYKRYIKSRVLMPSRLLLQTAHFFLF